MLEHNYRLNFDFIVIESNGMIVERQLHNIIASLLYNSINYSNSIIIMIIIIMIIKIIVISRQSEIKSLYTCKFLLIN